MRVLAGKCGAFIFLGRLSNKSFTPAERKQRSRADRPRRNAMVCKTAPDNLLLLLLLEFLFIFFFVTPNNVRERTSRSGLLDDAGRDSLKAFGFPDGAFGRAGNNKKNWESTPVPPPSPAQLPPPPLRVGVTPPTFFIFIFYIFFYFFINIIIMIHFFSIKPSWLW